LGRARKMLPDGITIVRRDSLVFVHCSGKLHVINDDQGKAALQLLRLDRILKAFEISPNRKLRVSDLQVLLRVPRRTLQYDLAKLEKAQRLRREGKTKASAYVLAASKEKVS
jgi:hypothetical protein